MCGYKKDVETLGEGIRFLHTTLRIIVAFVNPYWLEHQSATGRKSALSVSTGKSIQPPREIQIPRGLTAKSPARTFSILIIIIYVYVINVII